MPVIVYYVMQLLQFHLLLLLCVSMPNQWLKTNGDFWKNKSLPMKVMLISCVHYPHTDVLQVKETLPV